MLCKSFYNLDCTVQSNFHSDNLDKRTVSIKRPVEIFFKKYLLNVQYDLKIEGLNALTTRSYNRELRVSPKGQIHY